MSNTNTHVYVASLMYNYMQKKKTEKNLLLKIE